MFVTRLAIRRLASTMPRAVRVASCGEEREPVAATLPIPLSQRGEFPGIAAALTIEPGSLPEYAAPVLPKHLEGLGVFDNTPASNPIANAGATLGRVLFFDTQLNLKFFQPGTAFWDRRAASLEELATQPIRDSIELGFTDAVGDVDSLIRRMRTLPYYPELFSIAFSDNTITEERLRLALAQYPRSLVSRDSRFDRGMAAVGGVDLAVAFPDFTPEENRGKFLFMTIRPNGGVQCLECHAGPTLNLIANARSNGVDSTETRIFRSPSLESVATSRHFMHDGRFTSLEQVVEFYNSGVQPSPLLDQSLMDRNRKPRRLGLSAADKAALVAFMKTLTDENTPFESRFSNPFRR